MNMGPHGLWEQVLRRDTVLTKIERTFDSLRPRPCVKQGDLSKKDQIFVSSLIPLQCPCASVSPRPPTAVRGTLWAHRSIGPHSCGCMQRTQRGRGQTGKKSAVSRHRFPRLRRPQDPKLWTLQSTPSPTKRQLRQWSYATVASTTPAGENSPCACQPNLPTLPFPLS